ncbi:MAG: hypothetical protein GXP46_13155 [Deferribacteres bacterium]|nr:hypothetical protein [Deferribacteres bacterium]
MPVQSISTNSILVENSRFSSAGFLFTDPGDTCATESFERLGILQPVILYRDAAGELHLVDGRKRIDYARRRRMKAVSAEVLDVKTPVTDILTLILCDRHAEIGSSIINRILFICFAQSSGAPESWILDSLCRRFGLKPYNDFMRDCSRINGLPAELKHFCHEKRLSLKHIINLTRYPADILRQLMQWRNELALTASILDETASNLNDYLRADNKTLDDFLSEPAVREVMQSELSPRDKTARLRRLIHMKRFPVLTASNARIQETVRRLNLPEGISVDWDETLENRNVRLSVDINDVKQWRPLMETLSSGEVKKAVESILGEL